MQRESNPLVKGRPSRGNPKPVNTNRTVYVSRVVSIAKPAAGGVSELLSTDVIGALGTTEDIRVDNIKAWNTALGGSIRSLLKTGNLIDPSTNPKDIQVDDYGTGTSLAGVDFDIPMVLAQDITNLSTGTVLVNSTTPGTTDRVLYHVKLRFAV
jgi:hypothetical protein